MDFTALKQFMDRLTAWRIPGNTINVYRDNKKVFSYSSGYADIENKIPMTDDKLLNIYSCSKPVTVTAALQLYEKGYFLLDDPLSEYIPEFRTMYVRDENGNLKKAENQITLRHLFTMTAGLTYDRATDEIKEAQRVTCGRADTLTTVKYIAKTPLAFEPGTHWSYSLCHDVLAAVVEVISGERFSEYVKNNIFAPIGVSEVYYHRSSEVKNKMACRYLFKEESGEENTVKAQMKKSSAESNGEIVKLSKEIDDFELGSSYESGGAGMTIAPSDYAVFASALANGGTAPNGEKILSAGTVELLSKNQLDTVQLADFSWEHLKGYGYGLGVRTLIDKALSGTTGNLGEFGWGGAAGATLLVDTKERLSYFYAHHMLNPQESYYQPRLRNVVYSCINR